jgi:hypothetical protein
MDDPANQSQFGKTVALAADQLSGSAAVPLNGRYREGFRMPARRAIDPGFMTHAESKMDISGCLRRRY